MASSKSTKQELIKKYFTIEDAEELIPKVERVLKRIIKLNKHFHKLSYEFYANIEKIEDIGCIIKDLEIGIIDFYSEFEGREIFLCWKLGEKRIRFWHEVDSGYEGRRPILDLSRNR